jgi:hypothetical protein
LPYKLRAKARQAGKISADQAISPFEGNPDGAIGKSSLLLTKALLQKICAAQKPRSRVAAPQPAAIRKRASPAFISTAPPP